jgi:CubicO group peptidase (beta-lactamase class C family)
MRESRGKTIEELRYEMEQLEREEVFLADEEWINLPKEREQRFFREYPIHRTHDEFSVPAAVPDLPAAAAVLHFDYNKMTDYILNTLEHFDVAGFSYAIVKDGKYVDGDGIGLARIPSPGDDVFLGMEISTRMVSASLAKPLCAVSIMKLREEGKISPDLSDKVGSYTIFQLLYPDMDDTVKSITIYQLLTHTSGLPEGGSTEDAVNNPVSPVSPGGNLYSNKNYRLLALIVADLTQPEAGVYGSLVEYAKEHVLVPMTITTMSNQIDNNPCLYYNTGNLTDGVLWGNFSSTDGHAGWYASSIDWAKFLAYFRFNKVLSSTSRNMMLNDTKEYFGFKKWYGQKKGTYYGHGGHYSKDGKGFRGGIMGFPAGIDAVLLVNTLGVPAPTKILIDAYHAGFK